ATRQATLHRRRAHPTRPFADATCHAPARRTAHGDCFIARSLGGTACAAGTRRTYGTGQGRHSARAEIRSRRAPQGEAGIVVTDCAAADARRLRTMLDGLGMSQTKLIWVVGEDTNVGKSFISTALIQLMNARGIRTVGFK